MRLIGEDVEQQGCALDVHPVIAIDLVHRLASAGFSGQVDNSVGILKRAFEIFSNGYIAAKQVGTPKGIEFRIIAVDLRR